MLKNNIEIDVKTKCIKESRTQAQAAENKAASPSYVNKLVRKKQIVNKTVPAMMEDPGYDVQLTDVQRNAAEFNRDLQGDWRKYP